jgi:archaemetzincin
LLAEGFQRGLTVEVLGPTGGVLEDLVGFILGGDEEAEDQKSGSQCSFLSEAGFAENDTLDGVQYRTRMRKLKVTRIALILAAVAVWAGVMYSFVVKPVQKASQAEACTGCPVPGRTPAPEEEQGYEKLGAPKPGEWRSRFREAPQSFEQYIAGPVNWTVRTGRPSTSSRWARRAIRYREMLERMRVHSEAFFGVRAKVLDEAPMFEQTFHAERGQYDSSHLIDLLSKQVPPDALVFIGITDKDLSTPGLNFVFGEASLQRRCGVYSLTRYETGGLPLFTRRSLELVAHESGHILSIEHCVTYCCVMQGANSLEDPTATRCISARSISAKVLWNTGADRDDAYRRLRRSTASGTARTRPTGCRRKLAHEGLRSPFLRACSRPGEEGALRSSPTTFLGDPVELKKRVPAL